MYDMDVVVVGDILCDEWRYVATSAHNPENAMLCVRSEPDSEVILPGGAGLTAMCLQQLGMNVTLFGQLDYTLHSDRVLSVLAEAGVNVANVRRITDYDTPIKIRYLNAVDNVVIRHDIERKRHTAPTRFDYPSFEKEIKRAHCAVISDYDKGYLTDRRHALVRIAKKHNCFTFVDCKDHCIEDYDGASVFKVNQKTAESFAARTLAEQSHTEPAAVSYPCFVLHQHMQPVLTVVTRGANGVCFRTSDKTVCTTFPTAHSIGNAVGAGDAFLAGMVAYLLAVPEFPNIGNAAITQSVLAGHIAATEKIKSFAAELSAPLLISEYLSTRKNKVLSPEWFATFSRSCVGAGKTVVFTNGCFDVLHAGHMHLLRAAKAKGDILIVAVDSDENVRRLKGDDRPVQDEKTRADILAALELVDAVTVFTDTDDNKVLRNLIKRCRPHYLVKGGDYWPQDCVGYAEVTARKNPGKVVCCSYLSDVSTTNIIKKLRGENV